MACIWLELNAFHIWDFNEVKSIISARGTPSHFEIINQYISFTNIATLEHKIISKYKMFIKNDGEVTHRVQSYSTLGIPLPNDNKKLSKNIPI